MPRPDPADPFGTAALREGTLLAWASSPTRLREDAATEADLVRAGYRDRVLTELAQNAADAAARAGVPGALCLWRDGDDLHVANTGAPLDEAGVQALTALRASSKTGGVGRFGVGFTAAAAVSEDIEIRSRSGSIRFSAAHTRDALADRGVPAPESGIPVLRLAWPASMPPAPGWDTEVVLRLRPGIDAETLLDGFAAEAVDLLLELPALAAVTVGGRELTRTCTEAESGLRVVAVGERTWWEYAGSHARWLVPVVDGVAVPVPQDVLRAPTRSDEELSLPALVIADVPMQPDRRRLLPGAPVAGLARGYAGFVAALPPRQRPAMVPVPGFARSEVDALLREAVLQELRAHPWLPPAGGGDDLVPDRATALTGLTDELAAVLADVVPGLIRPDLCGPRYAAALGAVDVHRLGPARIAELLAGVEREPAWWYRLYEALTPLVVDSVVAEELAAIPVPLSDGRTVTGPRTAVLGTDVGHLRMPWVRLVHPDAAHPLLTRLGAGTVTAVDLLADPALLAAVEDVDVDDHEATAELAEVVLRLAAQVPAEAVPRELGALLLPDADGELVPADELLLPGAPLADVLVEDAPFAILDPQVAEQYDAEALRAVGVGWGFTVLRAELPTGPDHDLPDEEQWWGTLDEDPESLVAVRDLDLVDDARWDRALSLLVAEPGTAAALGDRRGYTAWWLRTYASLGGRTLGHLRAPDDEAFAGLLDPCPHPDADRLRPCLAATGVESTETAALLLDRLADPDRTPAPAVTARAHAALAAASAAGMLDLDALHLPDAVRSLAGSIVDAADALVLDRPWLAAVVPADRLVLGALPTAAVLADLLDVALASAEVSGHVTGPGRATGWRNEPAAVLAAAVAQRPLPRGPLVVHERLTVRCSGAVTGERDVSWWVDESGTTHCTGPGLAAAVAALSPPEPR
ncbi:sacsin N-terminal ATP-binding-like domain-containing protein [Rhodococcus aetherivorans]|uniref:sacsin N-terminal ATP-binding-like domain-containing protein n=1 Tax=Rhodococcus aetherivorans TaxID=191292 RepID=UPI00241D0E15|nr:ATP-binding protein [Rhodococcus aetherivorans]WFS12956.1 ATP-binding protein [Rhodococcus aetherivorans]